MPETMSKLKQYLYRIACAIREKEGSTGACCAADYPERIRRLALSLPGETGIYYTEYHEEDDTGVYMTNNVYTTVHYSRPVRAFVWGRSHSKELIEQSKLVYVEYLDGVPAVGAYSVQECTNLLEAVVGKDVTTIHPKAFNGCKKLQKVTLPDGLTTLEAMCFGGCEALSELMNTKGEHKLPTGITVIPPACFMGAKLANLQLHEGITEIGTRGFYGATFNCELPDSITTIGKEAFYQGYVHITKLPASLQTIGGNAFQNMKSGFNISRIPAGVTSIAGSAFKDNPSLTEITFEGTPTEITNTAFNGCTSITTINVPWAEGAVAGAPWGATNATINYNYVEGEV